MLKFVETHEARQAARKAPDADVAIGLSAMRFASMRWNHSLRRISGSPAFGEFRGPEEVRREPASGRLDDLAPNPAGWTTSTPMTRPLTGLRRRDEVNPCIDCGP